MASVIVRIRSRRGSINAVDGTFRIDKPLFLTVLPLPKVLYGFLCDARIVNSEVVQTFRFGKVLQAFCGH